MYLFYYKSAICSLPKNRLFHILRKPVCLSTLCLIAPEKICSALTFIVCLYYYAIGNQLYRKCSIHVIFYWSKYQMYKLSRYESLDCCCMHAVVNIHIIVMYCEYLYVFWHSTSPFAIHVYKFTIVYFQH